MFEMPVTDTLHPPPSSPPHTVFIMCRWAVEECSVVLQSSAGLIFLSVFFSFFFFLKCTSTLAHIVTVWRNEATRELLSQKDFIERLIYSTTIHTFLPAPLNPPPSSFSMSAFLFISFQSPSSRFSPALSLFPSFLSLKKKHPTSPEMERNKPFEAGMEGDRARPRHWQSSETQQGCEQLNIERLFGAVVMSQAREEKRGKQGKRRTTRHRDSTCFPRRGTAIA